MSLEQDFSDDYLDLVEDLKRIIENKSLSKTGVITAIKKRIGMRWHDGH